VLKASFTTDRIEAGCDEAGRGCLAGPVVAAAVILPKKYRHSKLNDSKQLSRAERFRIREDIFRDALAWAVAEVDHGVIDRINILNASILAMHLAVEKLSVIPSLLLIDGNRFKPYQDIPYQCIIKGDGKYLSIAAASVLAKTFRDEKMEEYAMQFPGYGWERNAGYPTVKHRNAIQQLGLTAIHRRSFRLVPNQMILFND
jgi:ribonuclease HII